MANGSAKGPPGARMLLPGHQLEVTTMPDEIRAPGPLLRLTRLLIGRNQLRRTSDRIEGVVLTMLLAALVASVVAAFVLSAHVYRSQRASAARLHSVMAVLSQNGPGDNLNGYGQAAARWRAPDGRERSGLLTTVTAPGIWGAAAGTRVEVWVTRSGTPAVPPSQEVTMCDAFLAAFCVLAGSGLVLVVGYGLCRLMLDRRRLMAWGSAWTSIGPRWSSLR
jgi:hypothetical protein